MAQAIKHHAELDDITAELDALSDLVFFISDHYLNEPTASSKTTGNALFAVQSYIKRISDDCMEIEMEQFIAKTNTAGTYGEAQ